VFRKTGCDCQDVQIKDYILRRETALLSQNFKGSLTNRDLVVNFNSLTFFVESHDNNSSSVILNDFSFLDKFLFSFFERNGIDNTLALTLLQAALDYLELGRIDHEGESGDFRVTQSQSAESLHRFLPVNESVVQVDIKNLSSVLNLIFRHLDRLLVLVVHDQLLESERPRDVATFSHVHEVEVVSENELLQAGEHRFLYWLWNLSPWN